MKKVIVSLTTFPAAVPYAVEAVKSILAGSLVPDRVVLYLAEPQFPGRATPPELTAIEHPAFEVRWCERDIRSYKKLVPALQDFPDDVIITVDDDVWYAPDMVRDMVRLHHERPDIIIANRAKRAKIDKPYKKWKKFRWYHFLRRRPLILDHRILPTGVGGVLYPPHSLDSSMMDADVFMELAPTTDDIWFWAAAISRGTFVVPFPFGVYNKPRGVGKPDELSLKVVNYLAGDDRNVAAMKKIAEKYPHIWNVLLSR